MAPHSSVLAWRIPGTGEPHGLPSTGSHRVRHDWNDLAAAATAGTSCKWNMQHLSFCVWQFHLAHKHLLGIFSLCSSQKFCKVILHYYAVVVVWFGVLRLEQHKLYWMAKEWRSRNPNSQTTPPFTVTLDLFLSLNFPCPVSDSARNFNRCYKLQLVPSQLILHKKNLLETCSCFRIFVGVPQTQRKSPNSSAWYAKLFTVWISSVSPKFH